MHKIFIAVLLFLLVSCSDKQVKWVANKTTIDATKYRLEISDSSKILIENARNYTLLTPHDSLLLDKFTISYTDVGSKANLYFRTKANQQVINSLNPKVIEYYKFENGNVLLLGYFTSDSLKPYTVFEPPLIISPVNINDKRISTGVMKTFIAEKNRFDEGLKTKLNVEKLKEIKFKDAKGTVEQCELWEIVLSRDATISYGGNNLIIPEVVMLKTKLLVNPNGYPIAEWSIKVEKIPKEETKATARGEIFKGKPNRKLYIELVKYFVNSES